MLKAKHGLSFIVAAVSVLLLVACGDGANAASSTPNKSSSADMEVRTYSELPTCAEKREGKTAYVKDQDQGYVCKSNEWVEDDDAVVVFNSCGTDSNSPNVVKGTFTDSRDGQTYKTVTIGTQTWMAQNLNYAYTDVPYKQGNYTSDSTSWCYKDDANNCSKYGRLYTWVAAMDSVGTWSTNGKGCGYNKTCSPTYPVRGICPEGWHLPTEEWQCLGCLRLLRAPCRLQGWQRGLLRRGRQRVLLEFYRGQ